jgi:hypothetical protein
VVITEHSAFKRADAADVAFDMLQTDSELQRHRAGQSQHLTTLREMLA